MPSGFGAAGSEGGIGVAEIEISISRRGSERVNLIALVSRLMRTWRTRLGSRRVYWMPSSWSEGSSWRVREMDARLASAVNIFNALRARDKGSEGEGEMVRRLESRRESVRMSSIIRF